RSHIPAAVSRELFYLFELSGYLIHHKANDLHRCGHCVRKAAYSICGWKEIMHEKRTAHVRLSACLGALSCVRNLLLSGTGNAKAAGQSPLSISPVPDKIGRASCRERG